RAASAPRRCRREGLRQPAPPAAPPRPPRPSPAAAGRPRSRRPRGCAPFRGRAAVRSLPPTSHGRRSAATRSFRLLRSASGHLLDRRDAGKSSGARDDFPGAGRSRFPSLLTRRSELSEPETHTLDVPGATLIYDVRRPDEPSDLRPLFIFGSPMGASGFEQLVSHLGDRTLITYDPRGMG